MWNNGCWQMNLRNLLLPTAFSNALSYEEQVCQIINAICDLAKDFKDFSESVIPEVEKMITEAYKKQDEEYAKKLESLKKEIEELLDDFREEVGDEIADTYSILNTKIEDVNENLSQRILNLSESYIDLLNVWYHFEDTWEEKLNARFKELSDELIDMITALSGDKFIVLNPVTNKYDNLNSTLKDLVNEIISQGAITAKDYDRMQITAQEYDDMDITAKDYDFHARNIFRFRLDYKPILDIVEERLTEFADDIARFSRELYFRSPKTGEVTAIQDMIYDLYRYHMNGITAEDYDAKEITAEMYDNLEIPAYDYDWKGQEVLQGI